MSRSLSAISLCLFGALSGGLLPACSSKKGGSSSDDALQEPAESGSLQLALTARGASGALYRLRDASFSVRRDDFGFFTSLSTENDPLATTIESTLPVGNFFIDIFGQFSLEKVENGATTRVNATLLSPAEQVFTIQTNEETFVGYRFETNGEIVDFGQGRLIVTLDVSEREGAGFSRASSTTRRTRLITATPRARKSSRTSWASASTTSSRAGARAERSPASARYSSSHART
jgi:hypothetical protein